ncbi:ATP-binding cassette domain-containing protein [Desulfobulbus alkaliphilus]|uniref:ATP-binding cassette domain-containing protein n=1 Tax=Desulfobulbus alkaliphilus TaxID=869814 RepID=UPI0019632640|nr:ATP-binding cassette domain-containing protein [Desulfobulbus alkaliphilus]MBM9538710.1 ATP-binding cassette domain-containing protein [Desulfobulbus alkaliphilus]
MNVVEAHNLSHHANGLAIYRDLNFTVPGGTICGLRETRRRQRTPLLVDILTGALSPSSGNCLIFGQDCRTLSADLKNRIARLQRGYKTYEVMTIRQTEVFFRGCYHNWQPAVFYDLVDRLRVSRKCKVSNLNESQRLLVALAVLLARDPDLLILDDCTPASCCRCLFLETLRRFAVRDDKTILIAGHACPVLEPLLDTLIVLDHDDGKPVLALNN